MRILNLLSDEMGFVSSLRMKMVVFILQVKTVFSIRQQWKIKISSCHGLHDRIIKKSLEGENSDVKVELKDCIALGSNFSTHRITKPWCINTTLRTLSFYLLLFSNLENMKVILRFKQNSHSYNLQKIRNIEESRLILILPWTIQNCKWIDTWYS